MQLMKKSESLSQLAWQVCLPGSDTRNFQAVPAFPISKLPGLVRIPFLPLLKAFLSSMSLLGHRSVCLSYKAEC